MVGRSGGRSCGSVGGRPVGRATDRSSNRTGGRHLFYVVLCWCSVVCGLMLFVCGLYECVLYVVLCDSFVFD